MSPIRVPNRRCLSMASFVTTYLPESLTIDIGGIGNRVWVLFLATKLSRDLSVLRPSSTCSIKSVLLGGATNCILNVYRYFLCKGVSSLAFIAIWRHGSSQIDGATILRLCFAQSLNTDLACAYAGNGDLMLDHSADLTGLIALNLILTLLVPLQNLEVFKPWKMNIPLLSSFVSISCIYSAEPRFAGISTLLFYVTRERTAVLVTN